MLIRKIAITLLTSIIALGFNTYNSTVAAGPVNIDVKEKPKFRTLINKLNKPVAMTLHDNILYFLNSHDQKNYSLYAYDHQQKSLKVISDKLAPFTYSHMAVSGNYVFLLAQEPKAGNISYLNLSDKSQKIMLKFESQPTGLFIDRDNSFYISFDSKPPAKSIARISFNNKEMKINVLKNDLNYIGGITKYKDKLYFSNNQATTYQMNLKGEILNTFELGSPSLAANGNYLYYAHPDSDHIGRINLISKTREVLAMELNEPLQIIYDNNHLFILEAGSAEQKFTNGSIKLLDLSNSGGIYKFEDVLEQLYQRMLSKDKKDKEVKPEQPVVSVKNNDKDISSEIKANMDTFQNALKLFAAKQRGLYPLDINVLDDETYWPDGKISNPLGNNKSLMSYKDYLKEKDKKSLAGTILYTSSDCRKIRNDTLVKCASYQIYGVDESGDLLKQDDKVYSLPTKSE